VGPQNAIGTGLWRIVGLGESRGGHHNGLLHRNLRLLAQRATVLRIGSRILLEGIEVPEAAIQQIRIHRHVSRPDNGAFVHLDGLRHGAGVRKVGGIVIRLDLHPVNTDRDLDGCHILFTHIYSLLFLVGANGRPGGQNIIGILAWIKQSIL